MGQYCPCTLVRSVPRRLVVTGQDAAALLASQSRACIPGGATAATGELAPCTDRRGKAGKEGREGEKGRKEGGGRLPPSYLPGAPGWQRPKLRSLAPVQYACSTVVARSPPGAACCPAPPRPPQGASTRPCAAQGCPICPRCPGFGPDVPATTVAGQSQCIRGPYIPAGVVSGSLSIAIGPLVRTATPGCVRTSWTLPVVLASH